MCQLLSVNYNVINFQRVSLNHTVIKSGESVYLKITHLNCYTLLLPQHILGLMGTSDNFTSLCITLH
jgi:hypothetical protein